MGVALHGNIVDFGLAEVFQLIGQQRKTGVLEITHGKLTMRLQFADGSVVSASPDPVGDYQSLGDLLVRCGLLTRDRLATLSAESQTSARPLTVILTSAGLVTPEQLETMVDLLTQETIFQVLRWTQGSFHFSARNVTHDRPPERLLAAEQILMDGLRMVDEWRTFAELVPSGDTIFDRSGTFASYREQAARDAGRLENAERIFQLIDGRLTVRRVIDLSRLGTFEGTRIVADLRRLGVIEEVDARQARRIAQSERSWEPLWIQARWAVAVATPLAILGLAAMMVIGPAAGMPRLPFQVPEDRPGWAIPQDPIGDARRHFEIRRLRNAMDTHRYLYGDWPGSMAELEEGGSAAPGALTPSADDPYYYVRRDEGIILLAPER